MFAVGVVYLTTAHYWLFRALSGAFVCLGLPQKMLICSNFAPLENLFWWLWAGRCPQEGNFSAWLILFLMLLFKLIFFSFFYFEKDYGIEILVKKLRFFCFNHSQTKESTGQFLKYIYIFIFILTKILQIIKFFLNKLFFLFQNTR